ncbi:Isochorismatase hydrolase [Mytilinidion resinicola]|uniref:Isochorismatase hydrolase n=1 Tax=Mytilinidion resinicola TaxID=574789 RepID=A0A6A6YQK4_9PEZI|nr:Isochorismatase hydrolase [Mytilinidion resinicola]KAF2810813.1 Isochorismatase hydrolase [Mytilinidion resinicola]
MSSRTALVLIDVQEGFSHPTHWGVARSTPSLEDNIPILRSAFRAAGAHIIHVQHVSAHPDSPLHPSNPGVKFKSCATPLADEPILTKRTNSAFIGTDLEERLRAMDLNLLVIAGLTTMHCVSTTTRMASNLGVLKHPYDGTGVDWAGNGRIVLVGDATAAFITEEEVKKGWNAELLHEVHLSALTEFCEVQTTEEVVKDVEGRNK